MKLINLLGYIENKLTLNSINNEEMKVDKVDYIPSVKTNNEEEMVKETEFFEEVINKSDNSKNVKKGKYDEKNKYIVEKFYNPFLETMKFKLKVNENNNEIKKSIRNSARINYSLIKKTKEVEKMSKECIIFNNPRININQLSKSTYNSFIKHSVRKTLHSSNASRKITDKIN